MCAVYMAHLLCIYHVWCMCNVYMACVRFIYISVCAIYKVYVWRIIYHTSSVYDQGWEFAHQFFDSFL